MLKRMRIHIHGKGNRLEIGDNVKLSGVISIFGHGVTVRIGDNFDAKDCKLVAWDANVTIGRDCLFASDIEIRSGDIHRIEDQATGEHLNQAQPIVLSDRVWVGSHVSILKGAKIPPDSVIATRSVVTRKFHQPGLLLGGAPAKVLREGIRWRR
jgi:acetyltransferase-like isoleucine patch superfamily enzyme